MSESFEAIEPIDVAAVAEWDAEADVVAVGLGCAGVSAAIEAVDGGADHGVPFEGRFHPESSREPPDDSGLVFSGGEDSWPFTDIVAPVPRMISPPTELLA